MKREELNNTEVSKLKEIEDDVRTRLISIKKNMYEIGKKLDEANGLLPYGNFENWIQETFDDALPYSTGYYFMRCYRTFKDTPEALEYLPTKYLHKMTENDFPVTARTFITEKVKEEGPLKGKWEHIVEFYKMYKEDMLDEDGLLHCIKRIMKTQWYENKKTDAIASTLFNQKERDSLYKKSHKILKSLDKLLKRANGYSWVYPFNQEDKLHNSVNEGIDASIGRMRELIKKLKKTKKALNGGEGLFNPVSTPAGRAFVKDEELDLTIDSDEIDFDELNWENWDDEIEKKSASVLP